MNPAIIKMGVGVVCAAATLIFIFWKNYRESQRSQQTMERDISSFEEDNVSICCICLMEFEEFSNKRDLFSLPCKHRFHRSCIKTLFLRENAHRSCPLCRRSVSEDYLTQRL